MITLTSYLQLVQYGTVTLFLLVAEITIASAMPLAKDNRWHWVPDATQFGEYFSGGLFLAGVPVMHGVILF